MYAYVYKCALRLVLPYGRDLAPAVQKMPSSFFSVFRLPESQFTLPFFFLLNDIVMLILPFHYGAGLKSSKMSKT